MCVEIEVERAATLSAVLSVLNIPQFSQYLTFPNLVPVVTRARGLTVYYGGLYTQHVHYSQNCYISVMYIFTSILSCIHRIIDHARIAMGLKCLGLL